MECPKPLKVLDKQYKYWLIENKKCIFTGQPAQANHHLPNPQGGKRKSRDDLQVPMLTEKHNWIHFTEEGKIWERENRDYLYAIAKACWEEYQAWRITSKSQRGG